MPRPLGEKWATVRDAELFAPHRMLVDSLETDLDPLLIDAKSEWWTIQFLPGRPDRRFFRRPNLHFGNRLRRLLNIRGTGA